MPDALQEAADLATQIHPEATAKQVARDRVRVVMPDFEKADDLARTLRLTHRYWVTQRGRTVFATVRAPDTTTPNGSTP